MTVMSAITDRIINNKKIFECRIPLGKVCQLRNGYAFQSSSYKSNGKYKILTIANVQGDRYVTTNDCKLISTLPKDIQEHQLLKENDILISMTGNVGRVSLCSEENFLLNQRVGLLTPIIKEHEFLFQILSSNHFEKSMIACGQGAAQMNIGKNDIDNYIIPFSKKAINLSLFANLLKAYDVKIDDNYNLIYNYILQKQYLLQQMFI